MCRESKKKGKAGEVREGRNGEDENVAHSL